MLGFIASVASVVWLALVFGWVRIPGDDGKSTLLLVIVLDVVLFGLGVSGIVRGIRRGERWIIAALVACAPLVHYAGSTVGGRLSLFTSPHRPR